MEILQTHWFNDAVPAKDIGFRKQKLDVSEDDHVIGTIGGQLESIVNFAEKLGIKHRDSGRKLITEEKMDFVMQFCDLLKQNILEKKIVLYGDIFLKSKLPIIYRENYDLYQATDVKMEKGLAGLQSRAFSQTNWLVMKEEIIKKNYPSHPVVCVDREIPQIYLPMGVHFYRQLKNKGTIKVQSEGILELVGEEEIKMVKTTAGQNEKFGYAVVDCVTSLLGSKFVYPTFLQHDVFNNIKMCESTLELRNYTDTIADFSFRTGILQKNWNDINASHSSLMSETSITLHV